MLGSLAAILIFIYMCEKGYWGYIHHMWQRILLGLALIGLYIQPVMVWYKKIINPA